MTRAAVVEVLATFPVRLGAAMGSAASRRVATGEWGPAEVVRHLIAVEAEVWQARLARVAKEDDPHWAWTEPGLAAGFDDAGLDQILAAFAAVRATTTATVRALDEAGWARHGTHATYGRLDVEGLLRIAIDHDASHLEQLQRT
jgi:DinB family protein